MTHNAYICAYGGYDVLVMYEDTLSTEYEGGSLTMETEHTMLKLIENLNMQTFHEVFNGESPLRMSIARFNHCMTNYESGAQGSGTVVISSIQVFNQSLICAIDVNRL